MTGFMQEIEADGRHRVLYTYDNKVHFVGEDPFGFWRAYLDKGQLTKELTNQRFTSYQEAFKAVSKYYEDKREVLSKTPIEKPVLETKKKNYSKGA